jgi:4-diphosphocytidyl-2C-methyl-D-erythritol kinase
VLPEYPVYGRILGELKRAGAAFAGLSGSGSCCFGVFRTKDQGEAAQKGLKDGKYFTKLTFFLAKNSFPW